MIPKKIQPYFKTTFQNKDGDNNLIEGMLICCNSHEFEILVVGEIKHKIIPRMCLIPENDMVVLEVRCKKCGKVISVFDSCCDGYEKCENNQTIHMLTKPINCKKCYDNSFSIEIKYEYPNIQELEELEITEIDNSFTWIWCTLKCNKCGTMYKNFIDYETT